MVLKLFSNKKGNMLADGALVIIVLLVLGTVALIGYTVMTDVNTEIQALDDMGANAKAKSQYVTDVYPGLMDGAFILAFSLFWLLVIVFSFMVDSHPVFLVIAIVGLVFLLIAAGLVVDYWEEMSTEPDFAITSFPMTDFILSNLVYFLVGIAFTIALALYGKSRLGAG